MGFKLDKFHYPIFPFVPPSKNLIEKSVVSIEDVLSSQNGPKIRGRAFQRISDALLTHEIKDIKIIKNSDIADLVKEELISYALSRMIVACLKNNDIINRMAQFEANRAYFYLNHEDQFEHGSSADQSRIYDDFFSPLCIYIAKEVGINVEGNKVCLDNYVECTAPLHQTRWKLVNRKLQRGFVIIANVDKYDEKDELFELIRQRIRYLQIRDFPRKIPDGYCQLFSDEIERVNQIYQEISSQNYGDIQETAFPPCIQNLIDSLANGKNLSHAGRFALTTFLHNIGMSVNQIAELYARSPDFDASKTMYQVEHITGRGGEGTEYSCPQCSAMRTTATCINPDKICEKVNHPLNYYKKKKWFLSKINEEKEKLKEMANEKTSSPPT
jgi:DNA primase large subunit